MNQVRRSFGAFVLATGIALGGVVATPAPADAFDVCPIIAAKAAEVAGNEQIPPRLKEAILRFLEYLAGVYHCE